MQTKSKTMKVVALHLVITLALGPTLGLASDEISQAGLEGQSFAKQIGLDAKTNSAKVESGQITVPSKDENGNTQYESTNAFDVNALYPGTSNSNNSDYADYFSDGVAPNVEGLSDLHDSESGMSDVGGDAKTSLWEDANSDNPSIAGSAYKVLVDTHNQSDPDFSNDPVLELTRSTYDNIDLISEGFGDCSTDTTFDELTMSVHNPEYKTCDRLYKPAGNCRIEHVIRVGVEPADVVFLIDNSGSMGSVIRDLRNNVGAFANLLTSDGRNDLRLGGAAFRERDYAWNKTELGGLASFQGWINGVYTKGARTYPYDAIAWAANHFSWRDDNVRKIIVMIGNDDVGGSLSSAKAAAESNGVEVYTFHNQSKGIGTFLANYFSGSKLLSFAQELTIVEDEWIPQSCIDDAIASLEEFCDGSYTSTPSTDQSCVTISGFNVCKNDAIYKKIAEPPIPNVPKLSQYVDVNALQCDFNIGTGTCWIAPNGEQNCLENDRDVDQCEILEEDSTCGFISSTCVEGAIGSQGNCYVTEETYDCGYSVEIPTVEKVTNYACGGEIRCMGDDCLDPTSTSDQSSNFAKASALLNAAQTMTQDMDCTNVVGEDDLYCTAFGGEAGECKIAVGGVANCCEKPSNISMAEYLAMISQVPKIDGAVLSLSENNVVKSAYQTIRDPVVNSWTETTNTFTSYMDNISGSVEEFFSPVEELKDELIEKLKEKSKEILQDIMGSAAETSATDAATAKATEEAADKAAEDAANSMASQGMSMLGSAMTVYSAYVATVAVIQMVYACEQEEFEMNAKRAVDSCTRVGSYCADDILGVCIEKREAYCCFNSPLSRIIQEQIRPQFGLDFGSSKNPSCGGIPLSKIEEIDWDKVNLDEWLAILKKNGQFPDESITMDSLTGSGNVFNIDGDRLSADQRAVERLDSIDVDEKRREAADTINVEVD